MLLLSLVQFNDLLSINGQVLVGVDNYAEESRVSLVVRKRYRGIARQRDVVKGRGVHVVLT